MRRKSLIYLAKILSFSLAYLLLAKAGLNFEATNKFAALVWLPSGIAVAVLLLFGSRLWPGILIGAFFTNLLTGAPLPAAIGISIGNTLESLISIYLLRHFRFHVSFTHLRDLLLLLCIIPLCTILSATIGVSSLFFRGVITQSAFLTTWIPWWIGDMMGILLTTPFLLVWNIPIISFYKRKKLIELTLLIFLFLSITVIVFAQEYKPTINSSSITYLVFPPIIWAALRFGQRITVTALFLTSIAAIIGTAGGLGPFAFGRLSDRLLLLESFISIIAITGMVLASVVEERKELEKRKDDFINMASHELRTPITSLKLYTQLLERHKQKQLIPLVIKMNKQMDMILSLIDDLLNLSKIQAEKLDYHKQWFDLQSFISEVIQLMQDSGTKHTIELQGKIKKQIFADKDRLTQVCINLLSNAIKYSPQTKKVIIKIKEKEENIIVSIQDFGMGIDSEYYDKIFDRFYRVDHADQKIAGLGIGLYITREILKRHGGKIWVESEKSKGSIFSFSLPLTPPGSD